ncbi:MAG: prepilin-type N-terminal cleavage/methylation domain-containing protein [Gammaproteobacteria bacterium]|nr:prepilin-type N-terminal cleavage/methylation domain-containing protein [Gammaproteobacteria bacterium]
MSTDPLHGRGFTLIELIVAIVVLAAGLAGIMLVFTQTVARSADPMLQQQAVALAEGYLDEILSKNNAPNCTANSGSGPTRATWIAVGDYNGLDESPPTDILGTTLAGLENYRVQARAETDTLAGVTGCKITVTVTHQTDAGVRSVLVGWRMPDE